MASDSRGRFVWHELYTTDPDAAIRFYGKVIGWGVKAWDKDASYRMWSKGDAYYGAVLPLAESDRLLGMRSHWLPYIATPDVDATVRQAKSLGARVKIEPTDAPGVGRYALLRDPQDVSFAVFTPSPGSTRPDAGLSLGDFSWHELTVPDAKRAWEFYRALFGWELGDAMDMGPAGTYQMFRRAGGKDPIGGMYNVSPGQPSHWLSYVLVPNADRAAGLVTQVGGKVMAGPMDVPNGRITVCIDPQGAGFAVHSITAAAPAKQKAKAKAKPKSKTKPKRRARPKAKPRSKSKSKARKRK